jgi:4-amino-4-deoxychorismate lyase
VTTLVDGVVATTVAADDRGLAYGDGLFETMRVRQGRAPLWDRHLARLREGCERLRIPAPDGTVLQADLAAASQGIADAVVRLTVTRGSGPRGYAPPAMPVARRVVSGAPMPAITAAATRDGVALFACQTTLALQPALAGIKHLNRLEQVLARAEWRDEAFGEGLLLDTAGRLACATAANLFVVVDGALLTPRVDRCGVAGVGRALVLDWFPDAREADLNPDVLARASEVFITSSVRGMLAVRAIGTMRWAPGPILRHCQHRWRADILQETT